MPKGFKKDGTKLGFQKGNKINVGRKPVNAFIVGTHPTEKTKKKLRASRKGRKPMLGKFHTEKWKKEHSQCMLGKNNPMWKGGISFEPYSVDWTETLRRAIRERDNYICQLCGKLQGDRVFSIHHIDYNKKNCNPENLITLCTSCHTKTNENRDYWKKIFKIYDGIK